VPLTTLSELKLQLGIPDNENDDDFFLQQALDAAEIEVISQMNREVAEATFTEYASGRGGESLNLRQGPLVSVTTVDFVTYGGGGSESLTTIDKGNFVLHGKRDEGWKLRGRLVGHNAWTWDRGARNYKVVYVAGWTAIPKDIKQAIFNLAAWIIQKRKDPAAVQREVGDGTVQFRFSGDKLFQVRSTIGPYLDIGF